MSGQQMARVNVDLETWHRFRIEAIHRGRSIADWLGELVEREVARIDRPPGRAEPPPDADPTRSEDGGPAGEEPAGRERKPPRPRPQMLDGQTLLTELPHAGAKPPPWEL